MEDHCYSYDLIDCDNNLLVPDLGANNQSVSIKSLVCQL